MAIELVIFDIGNVLIEWNPERYYDSAIGRARREKMFAEVDLHAMNDEIDRGADFRETIYAAAGKYPAWRDEIRQWHDHWIDLASPPIDHSVRLLRALRAKGTPVQALTNFGIGTFDYAATIYDFLNEFDMHHISGHMGVIKPDPTIYAMVEERCGHDASAILFVDDRPDNIDAARLRDWNTHLFDGPQGWADRLVAEGLLTHQEAS